MQIMWVRMRKNRSIILVMLITFLIILLAIWISSALMHRIDTEVPSFGFIHQIKMQLS